jgi:hypothetical protein
LCAITARILGEKEKGKRKLEEKKFWAEISVKILLLIQMGIYSISNSILN